MSTVLQSRSIVIRRTVSYGRRWGVCSCCRQFVAISRTPSAMKQHSDVNHNHTDVSSRSLTVRGFIKGINNYQTTTQQQQQQQQQQRSLSSRASEAEVVDSESDRACSGYGDRITKQTMGIHEYNDNQIEAMRFFEIMMTVDPNLSNDATEFNACRNQLSALAYGRTPPMIHEEMVSASTSPQSSSSSSSTTASLQLFHPAIRQSPSYTQLAIAALRRGYYNAKSHPWMIGWSMIQGREEEYVAEPDFYIQRYQGLWRYDIVQSMLPLKPNIGAMIMHDNRDGQVLVVEYHRDSRTHFSNSPTFPNSQQHIPFGNVHVALGFNDLQVLLHHVDGNSTSDTSSKLTTPTTTTSPSDTPTMTTTNQTSDSGDNHGPTPMKFVGYDRSTFSVAKTIVIAQMVRQQSSFGTSPHHIIEAWYSSTWNYETFMLFRYTCIALLKDDGYISKQQSSKSYPGNVQEEIRQYLHHWAYDAIPISGAEAIQRWLYESTDSGHVYTQSCSFRRKIDRIALLQYFTTGEFGSNYNNSNSNSSNTAATSEMVGSLTMWSVPDWAPRPNKTDQDRVNNTVLFQSILDEIANHRRRQSSAADDDDQTETSIMEAMYNIKLRQVTKLQQAVQSKQIDIDIRYGDIQPLYMANAYLVDEIRDLEARSMSWTNLVDYFEVSHFHELAHYWSSLSSSNKDSGKSAPMTTTHYGYTMNWPTTCYGTSISDYPTKKERQKILFETIETSKKESIENGTEEFITAPTFEHTEDQTGGLLGKQLRPKWVEYFIKEGKKLLPSESSEIVVKDEMQLHSPILRTNRSIYLTWTYR